SLLCFYGCRALRLLHSFPTRRSSDLILVIDEASAAAMIVVPVTSVRRTRVNYLSPDDQTPLARSRDGTAAESGPRDSLNGHDERSEEHTSELQSRSDLVCRLLLEKKK